MFSCIVGGCGQADQLADQFILQSGGFRLLAADACVDTAFVACGLLTLKTKHIRHGYSSNQCDMLFRYFKTSFSNFCAEYTYMETGEIIN